MAKRGNSEDDIARWVENNYTEDTTGRRRRAKVPRASAADSLASDVSSQPATSPGVQASPNAKSMAQVFAPFYANLSSEAVRLSELLPDMIAASTLQQQQAAASVAASDTAEHTLAADAAAAVAAVAEEREREKEQEKAAAAGGRAGAAGAGPLSTEDEHDHGIALSRSRPVGDSLRRRKWVGIVTGGDALLSHADLEEHSKRISSGPSHGAAPAAPAAPSAEGAGEAEAEVEDKPANGGPAAAAGSSSPVSHAFDPGEQNQSLLRRRNNRTPQYINRLKRLHRVHMAPMHTSRYQESMPEFSPELHTFLDTEMTSWGLNIFKLDTLAGGYPMTALGLQILERKDLFAKLHLDKMTVCRFLLAAEQGYGRFPDILYHNNVHGADVAHSTFCLLEDPAHSNLYSDLEYFAGIIAALCHDIGHPGVNNQFLVATHSPLATLYNDQSVLENFHAATTFKLMQKEELNIIANFDQDDASSFRTMIIQMILSTDMAKHFKFLGDFRSLVESHRQQNPDDPQAPPSICMTNAT